MERDRLRELLDATLGEQNGSLAEMARGAYASPFHFSRQVSQGAGESPVALRRRVLLERAAWRLGQGVAVTEVAFEAGYESVEGFSRAYSRAWGFPPSSTVAAGRNWLAAPNGIHFHPPTHLWVSDHPREQSAMHVTAQLIHHDLDDTRFLIEKASDLSERAWRDRELPGMQVLGFDGPEESLLAVLENLVHSKEVWLAAFAGERFPERCADSPDDLLGRHDKAAAAWLHLIDGIEQRDAWNDQFVDALCEPPESFVVGSVVAHVLTFSAQRRLLARHLLRRHGLDVDDGDPIMWLRRDQLEQERR